MFHVGHLNLLKSAKAYCDFLIVGVSTDELTAAYKHEFPVIPFRERIEIVAAIKYVDQVVPQTSMNKLEAWEKLHFDAVFHGDDWEGTALYDSIEKSLRAVGCDLIFLPYTENTSSTLLKQKLKRIGESHL